MDGGREKDSAAAFEFRRREADWTGFGRPLPLRASEITASPGRSGQHGQ